MWGRVWWIWVTHGNTAQASLRDGHPIQCGAMNDRRSHVGRNGGISAASQRARQLVWLARELAPVLDVDPESVAFALNAALLRLGKPCEATGGTGEL